MNFCQTQQTNQAVAQIPRGYVKKQVAISAYAPQNGYKLVEKRSIIQGGYLALNMLVANQAWALIPNDEDDELINKAKQNKEKRLQEQNEIVKEFSKTEGFTQANKSPNLYRVQDGIYKIAQAGKEIASGKTRLAADTLSSGWIQEFGSSIRSLEVPEVSGSALVQAVNELQKSSRIGDTGTSKRKYVAVVDELQTFVQKAGISNDLKGI